MATTATAGSAPPPATALRDPGLYDYLPWNDRPAIRWPNGARVAFWVAPNIVCVMPAPSTFFILTASNQYF